MVLDILDEMYQAFEFAPRLYQPSPFWRELNSEHTKRLNCWHFSNFKRTVATKYFNWTLLGIVAHQFTPIALHWLFQPDWAVFRTYLPNYDTPKGPGIQHFDQASALLYKLYVAMLAYYVAQRDRLKLLERFEEPEIGNPWRISYRDRWMSQDLCNSIYEFYSTGADTIDPRSPAQIAELGAGYGRLAYVFLKTLQNASYTIIDIPPALYISQEYLSQVFSEEHIFRFRPFQHYDEIREEFEAARIRFVMANQITLLPPKQIDLFVTISSLHEMTYEQITHYLSEINRLTRGRFFTKQWRKSRAKQNNFVIRESEYPIPNDWSLVRHRRHPIQSWFFESLYEIG